MKIGSLFTGYGGLDMAVERALDARTIWHAEYDIAPSRILAHHHPGTSNHGDITRIDWAAVEPVDVLTGGYPCQPFSAAGRRQGTNDDRHLWPYVREAIRHLRPRLVVLENVAGHRSMGFDRVLGDMAEDGLDAWWTSIRASDVGAAHHRERLFILAAPANTEGEGLQARIAERVAPKKPRPIGDRGIPADAEDIGREWRKKREDGRGNQAIRGEKGDRFDGPAHTARGRGESALADADGFGCGQGAGQPSAGTPQIPTTIGSVGTLPADRRAGDVLVLPTPTVGNATGTNERRGGARSNELLLPGVVLQMLPTPRTTDANGAGSHGDGGPDLRTAITEATVSWGKYEPAIRRWEQVVGPAPAPTELNSNGKPRLSAAFAEWMMGLPAGHVTDPAIGISRGSQLKAIGNGVCPQQAYAALCALLTMSTEAA